VEVRGKRFEAKKKKERTDAGEYRRGDAMTRRRGEKNKA
jgi:hypothetical protein